MSLNRILQPVRDHFEQNAEAAALLKKVKVQFTLLSMLLRKDAGDCSSNRVCFGPCSYRSQRHVTCVCFALICCQVHIALNRALLTFSVVYAVLQSDQIEENVSWLSDTHH